jgi:hypothetical protein
MAYQATPSDLAARAVAAARSSAALRSTLRAFALSRVAVACVAVFAALSLGPPGPGGLGERNAASFDDPALTHTLGGFGEVVLSPLARWDAVWYLRIADSGYDTDARPAFFPLYPLLVRGAGEVGGGSPGARLAAAYVLSLAAFLGALLLLHRLTELELGRRTAGTAVLLLALFPASLYFGAPYSESFFLLSSVAAFYAARTDRWAWAGAAAAAGGATRSAGVLLLVPLAIIYVQQHGRRPRLDALWLLLAPAGLALYALYLGLAHGEPLAFLDAQHLWQRDFAGPLVGAWDGVVTAAEGARQLLSGSSEHLYVSGTGGAQGGAFRVAAVDLVLFGFLLFSLAACAGALRRLPLPYGLWAATALVLPLSYPVGPQPLMSLPRFTAVLFPLFMWLALVCEERRMTPLVMAVSAVGLGLFTAQFATWHWVA